MELDKNLTFEKTKHGSQAGLSLFHKCLVFSQASVFINTTLTVL